MQRHHTSYPERLGLAVGLEQALVFAQERRDLPVVGDVSLRRDAEPIQRLGARLARGRHAFLGHDPGRESGHVQALTRWLTRGRRAYAGREVAGGSTGQDSYHIGRD